MFDLIGETLRRLRKERRLTLEELGAAADLGRGQLSRIENSHQEATLTTLGKILTSQGVSRREFFRRYDLVEAEKFALGREGGNAAAEAASWPREVQDVLSSVEAFLRYRRHDRPVAQGAIEMGDFVVLFRVVPKEAAAAAPPEAPSGNEAA